MSEDGSVSSSSSTSAASTKSLPLKRRGGAETTDNRNDENINNNEASNATTPEPTTKHHVMDDMDRKRRRRFSANNPDSELTNLADDANSNANDGKCANTVDGGVDCEVSSQSNQNAVNSSVETISISSSTSSESTVEVCLDLELADTQAKGTSTSAAAATAAVATSPPTTIALETNLIKNTTDTQNSTTTPAATDSLEEFLAAVENEAVPTEAEAGVAAASDSNNLDAVSVQATAATEEDSTNEFPALRFLNLRRRHYRRSGQRISSISSESSDNSLTAANGRAAPQDGSSADLNFDDSSNDSNIFVYMNNTSDSEVIADSDLNDNDNDSDGVDININSVSDSSTTNDDDDNDDEEDNPVQIQIHGRRNGRRLGMFRSFFHRRAAGGGIENAANSQQATANNEAEVEAVLTKPMPVCKWNTLNEVLRREHGLSNRFAASHCHRPSTSTLAAASSSSSSSAATTTKASISSFQNHERFNARFYASTFVVERMKRSHCLRKHRGCVNSLNFNRCGDLLCSGSDDRRIVVWDWSHNKIKHIYSSGHRENIFQSKFLSSSAASGVDIISAGRDGQVRRSIVPPHGKVVSTCLYKHRNAVHKLVICPNSQYEILSAGEDGHIRHCDLRDDSYKTLALKKVTMKYSPNAVLLFGITHHPYAPEIAVCGSDEYVRVYDKRKFEEPLRMMSPARFNYNSRSNLSYVQVTCCTYNHNGSEILATYSDEQIYLFDNKNYTEGSYLHTYNGHYNHRTIKGVNFFGPNSEYIVSGSDCGNIFFWDKETEAILNCMPGDDSGVVNCLEPHPSIPVLATSGLDYNVKIWAPGSQRTVPIREKLKKCVSRNIKRSEGKVRIQFLDRALNNFILQTIVSNTSDGEDDDNPAGGGGAAAAAADSDESLVGFELGLEDASTSQSESEVLRSIFDSDDDDSDEPDAGNFEGLTCSTQ